MEFIVESPRTEQVRIFGKLKMLFAESATAPVFLRLKFLENITIPLDIWDESFFNQWNNTDDFTIYCRRIDGILRWIVVTKKTNRQYIMIMKK